MWQTNIWRFSSVNVFTRLCCCWSDWFSRWWLTGGSSNHLTSICFSEQLIGSFTDGYMLQVFLLLWGWTSMLLVIMSSSDISRLPLCPQSCSPEDEPSLLLLLMSVRTSDSASCTRALQHRRNQTRDGGPANVSCQRVWAAARLNPPTQRAEPPPSAEQPVSK